MSPKSRGRKSKRTARRPPADRDPARQVISELGRSLAEVGRTEGPLAVEVLASMTLDGMLEDGDAERDAGSLVTVARRCATLRTSDALGVALVLAVLAPQPEVHAAAARSVTSLRGSVAVPPWAEGFGAATVVRCAELTDVFGDQSSVLCESRAGARRDVVVFLVDHNGPGPFVRDIFASDDADGLLADFRAAGDDGDLAGFAEVPVTETISFLHEALHATLGEPDLPTDDDFSAHWVMALARLHRAEPAELPEPSRATVEELVAYVEEFAGSSEAAGLDVAARDVQHAAMALARYGNDLDEGRPLRVGPGKTAVLLEWLLTEGEIDVATSLPVVLAWNRWAARRQELPQAAVDELVAATEAMIQETARFYGADVPVRRRPAQGDADEAARRDLAMPYRSATIRGETLEGLDPADDDELELLIIGEHPQYQEALGDPSIDEVDGVNPQVHIALHHIVAKRLWDNEPRETWREGKRMLAQGVERHDVLHALMEPVAHEVHAALSPELGLIGQARPRRRR